VNPMRSNTTRRMRGETSVRMSLGRCESTP
jgi:hypothetical protein